MDRLDGAKVQAESEPPRILVIDHDAVVRGMLRAHLVRAGYDVSCAQDAIGAAHLVAEASPCLVICEARLPDMNGYEFVAALRSEPLTRDVPVVLLTVKGEMQQGAERLGIVAAFKKPVALERLMPIVRAFAERRMASAAAVPIAPATSRPPKAASA